MEIPIRVLTLSIYDTCRPTGFSDQMINNFCFVVGIVVITVEPTFQRCYFQCARKRTKYQNKESSVLLTCGLFFVCVFGSGRSSGLILP